MKQFRQNSIIRFFETLLRGVGNVVFQDNALAGLIILIGIGVSAWTASVDFLIGAAIATLIAKWFKADEQAIEHGMFAFSGGYVGLLMGTLLEKEVPFLTGEWLLFLVLGGILAVPVAAG